MTGSTAAVDAVMVLTSGLLGSSHCVGMCGPIVVAIGGATANFRANVRTQLLFSLGRIFTYGFLGALAGFGGARLIAELPPMLPVQSALAILAGLLLIFQGLSAAGVIALPISGATGCAGGSLFAPLFRLPGAWGAFAAGLFTGFLPCGLVYAFLSLAISTGTMPRGWLLMTLFGMGTTPVMVLTGCSGSLMAPTLRRKVLSYAAWCVVATGVIALVRGVLFACQPGSSGAPCPFCT
jgi:sulfite exporter TauE/SafE